jgi:transcriptional regulator with XRE-family HTH domain
MFGMFGARMYQAWGPVLLIANVGDSVPQLPSPAERTEKMASMTETDALHERITALDLHRQELGVTVERLCTRAGLTAQSWRDMRNGKRGVKTVEKFERALEWIEEHADEQVEPDASRATSPDPGDLVTFEITGDFGVRVVVRGPVNSTEALERSVERIIRDIRASQDTSEG